MSTDAGSPSIRIELLGPLRLVLDGVPVAVPGPKRGAVLAMLALAEGRTVIVDDLLDALWAEEVPVAARAALHSHISRLRGHLGSAASRLEAVSGGYRLRLEPKALDVQQARGLMAESRRLADSDPAEAYARLREARELWRGPALADLNDIAPIAARSVAVDELRREVNERLVERGIAAGDAAGVMDVAVEGVAEEPLRESAVILLARCLAETGRNAEALRACHQYRRRLRDEAGLDPSAELQQLERALAKSAGPSQARLAGAVPAPLTPLVGRESEIAALQRLLATDRLVTVVGPGGVGKTRLAIDVARRHDDATYLALGPVTDSAAIPHSLAASLQLGAVGGDPLNACVALLAAGARLLVLDNCEHLIAALRDMVTTLLETCPQLAVLATSRERLGLPVERQVRLGPLALPGSRSDHPERAPAVALFIERSRRVRPEFSPSPDDLAEIVDIVRGLDGLPLSIELAAGRLSSLSLRDLHARLDRALDLLDTTPKPGDERQQTLRATIEWSYDLLAEPEQRLFRHLAVFPDGVDLSTAEAVGEDIKVPGDVTATLTRLVDASMLDADLEAKPRYRMLETVRAYGLDRLAAAGEADKANDHLMRWAVDVAQGIDASLHTVDEAAVNAQLRQELPNLRAAWSLARQYPTVDHAIEIVVSLDDAAQWRDLAELWHWAEELAADARIRRHPRAAAALAAASDGAWLLGHLDHAARLAQQALELANDDDGRWRALLAAAVVDLTKAEFAAAVTHALEAAELSPRPAHCLWIAALAAAYSGDVERAEEIARRGEATSPTMRAEEEYVAGEIASIAGRVDRAQQHYQQAIDLARQVGATFVVGIATVGLLGAWTRSGRYTDALRSYRDVLAYWERSGNWIQIWTTLRNLADLMRMLGDAELAVYLEAAADHAPDSATITDATWPGAGAATTAPPADTAAAIHQQAVAATPAHVLDVARLAIETHLRDLATDTQMSRARTRRRQRQE